jgi:hypothetical protein
VFGKKKVTRNRINLAYQERKAPAMSTTRLLAALLGIAAASVPLAAFAQEVPATAAAPNAPSYARRPANGEDMITGKISSFQGKYDIQVRDDRGFIDKVEMHQGTVINPTGLALQPGMSVTILGYNRGRVLAANEIDAPYPPYVAYGYPLVAVPYHYGYSVGFGPVYFHQP